MEMTDFYKIGDYPEILFEKFYRDPPYLKIRERVKKIIVYIGRPHLGDLVLSIPFFRNLKKMFPDAQVVYAGCIPEELKDFFSSIPYIDGYLEYTVSKNLKKFCSRWKTFYHYCRKEKIDLLIDTQRYFTVNLFLSLFPVKFRLGYGSRGLFSRWRLKEKNRQAVHDIYQTLALLRVLGLKDITIEGSYEVPAQYLLAADAFLASAGANGKKLVSIFPGAASPARMWPGEKFARVADYFLKNGYAVLLLGSGQEKKLLNDLKGKMTEKPLIPLSAGEAFKDVFHTLAFCQKSSLVISNDSGGVHLASLTGTPVIGIYGYNPPVKWGPWSKNSIALHHYTECFPCRLKDRSKCPFGLRCLTGTTAAEVIRASLEILR